MEEVLVVRRDDLEKHITQERFMRQELPDILDFIISAYFFVPRDKAEYDKSLKQIIPYVIVRQEGRFFLLKRLQRQTEKRLHHRLSLGVGGHINPTEQVAQTSSILEAGMQRELTEELSFQGIERLSCVGVVNDYSGGVNDYHLGLVYLLDALGEVSVRETEKMEGSWADLKELEASFDALESWSQILLEELLRKDLYEKADPWEASGDA